MLLEASLGFGERGGNFFGSRGGRRCKEACDWTRRDNGD